MVNQPDTSSLSIDKRDIGDVPDLDRPKHEDSDDIMNELNSKVNSMSMGDREAGLFDLHGISNIDEKTRKEEEASVTQMRFVITQRHSWWASEAFRMADSQSPEYTRDPKFLLMFLRCESYNIDAAVKRLFAFFKQKLRLFGPEKVGKRMITLDDMNEDDMKCYNAGFFQLLPHRDHVGRVQFVSLPLYAAWQQRENGLRMMFHLFTTAAIDEETQKNGAVAIIHSLHNDNSNSHSNDPVFAWDSTQLMQKAVPIRVVAQHVCTNPTNPLASLFYTSMSRFLDKIGIARIRFHKGSSDEVEKQLATFGINNVQLVITQSGEKKTIKHKEYIERVKAMEHALSSTPNKVIRLVPSSTDILLGRGKPIQNHPGNVRLGLIVESQLIANIANTSQEKTKLAEITIAKMKHAGVRFLTKENGYWEEVTSDRIMRERVSSAFRTVRDRIKLSKNNMDETIDTGAKKRSSPGIDESSYNKKFQSTTVQHVSVPQE